MRRFVLISVPYLWLLTLFLIPFVIVFKIALSDAALAIPPYMPTMKDGLRAMLSQLDFENFVFFVAFANGIHDLQVIGGFNKGFRIVATLHDFGNFFFVDAQ